jgi:hypothetical protein
MVQLSVEEGKTKDEDGRRKGEGGEEVNEGKPRRGRVLADWTDREAAWSSQLASTTTPLIQQEPLGPQNHRTSIALGNAAPVRAWFLARQIWAG